MCTNKKLILFSACFALTVQASPQAALHAQTACEVQQMRLVPANRQTAIPNKKSEVEPNMALIRETLELPDEVVLIPFSAEKGNGKDALMAEILKYV